MSEEIIEIESIAAIYKYLKKKLGPDWIVKKKEPVKVDRENKSAIDVIHMQSRWGGPIRTFTFQCGSFFFNDPEENIKNAATLKEKIELAQVKEIAEELIIEAVKNEKIQA